MTCPSREDITREALEHLRCGDVDGGFRACVDDIFTFMTNTVEKDFDGVTRDTLSDSESVRMS